MGRCARRAEIGHDNPKIQPFRFPTVSDPLTPVRRCVPASKGVSPEPFYEPHLCRCTATHCSPSGQSRCVDLFLFIKVIFHYGCKPQPVDTTENKAVGFSTSGLADTDSKFLKHFFFENDSK